MVCLCDICYILSREAACDRTERALPLTVVSILAVAGWGWRRHGFEASGALRTFYAAKKVTAATAGGAWLLVGRKNILSKIIKKRLSYRCLHGGTFCPGAPYVNIKYFSNLAHI